MGSVDDGKDMRKPAQIAANDCVAFDPRVSQNK